jgi:hypothetical protein
VSVTAIFFVPLVIKDDDTGGDDDDDDDDDDLKRGTKHV